MEFKQKLQFLRTQAGLTQEQLAEKLFVSRVTISKWESGRGYPNIESLKLIAKVFSVSIDELLSSNELMSIAETQVQESTKNFTSLVFGILDAMLILLLFIPLFGNHHPDHVEAVSLGNLTDFSPTIMAVFYTMILGTVLFGFLELLLQNVSNTWWNRISKPLSTSLSVFTLLFFIMTQEPYASAFVLCFLVFKGVLLVKQR